jgi:cytochrome c biogenesis protein CcdA
MTPVTFDLAAYGFGLLAGILSILSPCVLPLLPIVLGAALTAHRFGAIALSAGLALSFVLVGLFVATIGFSLGLDGDFFRRISAVMLLVFGLLILVPSWQASLMARMGRLGSVIGGDRLRQQVQGYVPIGLAGQFVLGLLLGVIWSPCVGPTLGAAATLAAQRQNLGAVAAMMTVFGIGASLPLLVIGLGLARVARRGEASTDVTGWQRHGQRAGRLGKHLLGLLLILLAILILTGLDRQVEARLVDWSPAWLTTLTTHF